MNLNIGIVGLPNVGKSTLFNALTNGDAYSANFPFATIEPNIRIVDVPDKRLYRLSKIYNSEKIINASLRVVDIAGLVKGASKGEGLGNKFLSNIREVDAIAHVIRGFKNNDISHVEGKLDIIRDIKIINNELILSDLEIIENRMKRIKKMAEMKKQDSVIEYNAIKKIYDKLLNEEFANSVSLSEIEMEKIKSLSLITLKPFIYVCNLDENELTNFYKDKKFVNVIEYVESKGSKIIPVCALIEQDLNKISAIEREEYLKEMNIQSSIDIMIREFYNLLNLISFFTIGKIEAHAWTISKGTKAPEAAGVIHTDFKKGFIKAEVINYEKISILEKTSEIKSFSKIEGKDYIVKDGDIIHFRYNI